MTRFTNLLFLKDYLRITKRLPITGEGDFFVILVGYIHKTG